MSIIIYSKEYCPHCVRAKQFLEARGLPFKEIDITHNSSLQEECFSRSNGKKTVPQIFVGDTHVGGFDDMMSMVKNDTFDKLIKNTQ